MAIPASVLQDWEALSAEDRIKAQSYIKSLLRQADRNPTNPPHSRYPLGIWNGGLQYMADDFNETPEGFEDYV